MTVVDSGQASLSYNSTCGPCRSWVVDSGQASLSYNCVVSFSHPVVDSGQASLSYNSTETVAVITTGGPGSHSGRHN